MTNDVIICFILILSLPLSAFSFLAHFSKEDSSTSPLLQNVIDDCTLAEENVSKGAVVHIFF